MNFMKNKIILTAVFAAMVGGTSNLHAQTEQQLKANACSLGVFNPFVGAWEEKLEIAGRGSSKSLITLNQGGTLTETDGVDLVNPARPTSPGYGAWKALDCEHYVVTIQKVIYNATTKQFESTVLHGTALLSLDHNSWTATLDQRFFDDNGAVLYTDMVTATATRIKAEPTF